MRRRFTKLFGNEDTKLRLCDAVVNSTLPHALLICGPRGSGKRTLSTEIIAASNCLMKSNSSSPIPCKVCANCKRIYSSSFPDVTVLERESGKATIGVEELRVFRESMFLSASEAAYKFYVIEDADTMTPAAQNALLKVLEEPPQFVHIILLAESGDKLLSTIKSRTQFVQMELFAQNELEDYVTELSSAARTLSQTAPKKLLAILLASGGVIGKALEMMDDGLSDGIEAKRDAVKSFISVIHKRAPFSKLYSVCSSLPQKRDELRETLEEIRTAIRDLTVIGLDDNANTSFFLSKDEASEFSEGLNRKRLIEVYDVISSAIEDLDKNVVVSTLLTDIAVRIKG